MTDKRNKQCSDCRKVLHLDDGSVAGSLITVNRPDEHYLSNFDIDA